MNISIEKNVLDYLKKQKTTVMTVEIVNVSGGCSGMIQVPNVILKKPEVLSGYVLETVDGIDIYFQNSALVDAGDIVFKKTGFSVFTTIAVEGLKYSNM